MPRRGLGKSLVIGNEGVHLPKVNFKVNQYSVLFSSIASEIRAKGTIKRDSSKRAALEKLGLLDPNWTKVISEFANEHREDFLKSKLFSKIEIFDTLIPFADKIGTPEFESIARSRLEYQFEMTDEEIEAAMRILTEENLSKLVNTHEFSNVLAKTNLYRRKVESDWIRYSSANISSICELIGLNEIEACNKNKKKQDSLTVLVLPPVAKVQRMADKTKENAVFCISVPGDDTREKTTYTNGIIIDALIGSMVAARSIPMTAAEREKQDAYGKYITVKSLGVDLGNGKSIFDFQVPRENKKVMGQVYPAYLAYKHRRKPYEEAVESIKGEIERDRLGLSKFNPVVSEELSGHYRFDELSPEAVAGLFRGQYVGMADFAKLNLEDVGKKVYINPTVLHSRKPEQREERMH